MNAPSPSAARADALSGAPVFLRQSAFGTTDGKRNAWVRYPDRRTTVIILTSDDAFDARAVSQQIAERPFSK